MQTVSFPGLGIGDIELRRIAFNVFGKDVYWYGVIICVGLILAIIYGLARAKKSGVSVDDLLDVALVAIPSAIIAARLFYVLTDGVPQHTFAEVIAVWDGGISILGAIIGGIIAVALTCLVKKMDILNTFDLACRCLIIGQIIGRLGNFVNVEVYGVATDLPWGMYIVSKGYAVHPLFAYEMLWNIAGFIILCILARRKKFNGEVFCTYVAWYGLGRFFLEPLRDEQYILSGNISQIVAGCAFVIAVALFIVLAVRAAKKKKAEASGEPAYEPQFSQTETEGEPAEEAPAEETPAEEAPAEEAPAKEETEKTEPEEKDGSPD